MANKTQLEEEIDNMPSEIKNRKSRRSKLNERLYSLYDKIEMIEERIANCNVKMSKLRNEELTLDNIKTLLENFKDIYDVISETERKQLIRYLFNRIDLYPDFTPERLIKSVELNFRIHNNQKVIKNILEDESNKSLLVDELTNVESDYEVPVTFDLEENDILQDIYEKVNLRYKKECTVRTKKRGPYKKEKATNREMKKYILDNYSIKVHDSDITALKKYYGIIKVDSNEIKNIKLPKKSKCDIIKEALIHFTYIDDNCKPVGESEEFVPNRSTHYIKPHATYNEIKAYILE